MAIAATALLPLSQALNGGLPYIPRDHSPRSSASQRSWRFWPLRCQPDERSAPGPLRRSGRESRSGLLDRPRSADADFEGSRRSPALLLQRPRGGSCDTMSSGAFAPVGAKAGLTHDAGRTSFSPDPLSAACLNACRLELALDRRDRDRQRQARTRGSSPDARHRPDEQHFGVPASYPGRSPESSPRMSPNPACRRCRSHRRTQRFVASNRLGKDRSCKPQPPDHSPPLNRRQEP